MSHIRKFKGTTESSDSINQERQTSELTMVNNGAHNGQWYIDDIAHAKHILCVIPGLSEYLSLLNQ